LTGIADVDGNGILEPGTSCKSVWIIIPKRDAAPDIPLQYYVGGTLSYSEAGTQIDMPLFPATITVKPDPKLVLHYFLERVVYSDDPFTKDIEPAEPFALGLILQNKGKGTAHQVKITSSQPEIEANEKGLLIDFKIINTQVNTEKVTPSLTVDLGKIEPSQTSVAQWMMTSSLQGKFIEYDAKFEHIDDLGDSRTSLIDSVNIHELLHVVRSEVPEDDNKPDFLVNDIEDDNFMPDMLYKSDGSTALVNPATNAVVNGQVSNTNLEVILTANAPDGWVYIRVNDPGQEKFRLTKAVRSDGKAIRLEDNVWTTHRTIRLAGQEPYRESLLHLLDYVENGNCTYTLTYENPSAVPEPPELMFILDRSFPEGLHFGFLVIASDPNGTMPTISAEPLPQGAVLTDKGNGEWYFDWATSVGQAGKYEITFVASDGTLTDSQIATIIIYSPEDSDKDDMPDDWETEKFGTLDRDGKDDFDQNGISDIEEYLNEKIPAFIEAPRYIITSTAGTNGRIEPSGEVLVNEGEIRTFFMYPDEGYVIQDVTVDGESVIYIIEGDAYTFTDIRGNHRIEVIFSPMQNYSWDVGLWTECSNSCGQGTQTRIIRCLDSKGNVVSDRLCSDAKPSAVQSCSDNSGCGALQNNNSDGEDSCFVQTLIGK